MYNKVTLVGRLGGDPESKTHGSTNICTFQLATNEAWKDKASGEKQQRTEWHRISVFNQLASICQQYLKKGALVLIEGSIRHDEFEDKEGNKRYMTSVIAREMKMLDKPGEPEKEHFSDLPF